jgi:hypothetical protein
MIPPERSGSGKGKIEVVISAQFGWGRGVRSSQQNRHELTCFMEKSLVMMRRKSYNNRSSFRVRHRAHISTPI